MSSRARRYFSNSLDFCMREEQLSTIHDDASGDVDADTYQIRPVVLQQQTPFVTNARSKGKKEEEKSTRRYVTWLTRLSHDQISLRTKKKKE